MTKKHSFLSEAGLKQIKPPKTGRSTWKDAKVAGLTLNVGHTGGMVWYGIVRNHEGKTERQKLGHFLPNSDDGLSLERARAIVENARLRARAGLPPWADFHGDSENTFAAVRDRFMRQAVSQKKPNTQIAYHKALHSKELETWEQRKVADITKSDVIALIDKIVERGALVQANRTLAYVRRFFNWCAEKDIIKEGQSIPTDRVKAPLKKEKPRNRVLSEEEIKELWAATESLNHPFKGVVRLMLVTGQRKGEVAAMRWADVDAREKVWTQKDNKATREHLVPLSALALEVLNDLPRLSETGMIFTTTGTTPPSGFSKAKRHLDKAIEEVDGSHGTFAEPWQLHDIRRTVTTHMRRLRVPQHVCARILNHADKGVTGAVYDVYDMLPEKTEALEKWAGYISRLISDEPSNVLSLREPSTV